MFRTIITVILALNFLFDPVGYVEHARDVGAPIIVDYFATIITPAIQNVKDEAAAQAARNR